MSDELIKRLRAFPQIVHVAGSPYWLHVGGNEPLCAEAADALERVTRERDEARQNAFEACERNVQITDELKQAKRHQGAQMSDKPIIHRNRK